MNKREALKMKNDKNRIYEEAKQFLIENVSSYAIVVFGSFAKGTVHKDSDIDIAFLSEKTFSDYHLFMLAQKLADILGRQVDLVQLDQVSTVLQAQIVGTGKVIYCSDDTKRMFFEMRVLKSYAKLNEERKPILEAISESGTVYDQ